MQIIGFSGKSGAGKSTAAQYLIKQYGFTKISLAGPIKIAADSLFPGLSSYAKEVPFRNYDWTPREFLVNLGALLRFHDPAYWLRLCIIEMRDNNGKYVVDDVRFHNEVDGLKRMGGKIVRINRFEKMNPYKSKDIESEKALDEYKEFDYTITEQWNTSLRNLHTQCDMMLKGFDEHGS